MHTLNRFLTCLLLLVVLVPPATFALVSLDEKTEAQEELSKAIDDAVHSYQQRSGLQGLKGKNERILVDQKSKISSFNARKRELRLAIAAQKDIVHFIEAKYGLTLGSKQQVQQMVTTEKRRMERIVRNQYLRTVQVADTQTAVIDAVFHGAAAEHREDVAGKAQEKFLRDLVAAEKAFWRLEALEQQRTDTLNQFWAAQNQYDKAEQVIERSEAQLEEIKTIMEDVHLQVLKMQSDLARIDARLKEKAERALIEKGLLDPKNADASNGVIVKPQFSWPVYGRVSAGFMNAEYKVHFGVPHYGLDIVVGQDTPVNAAADGVVFLVRDGGKTGYSYILIGHRGGYATLYGHVSQALVTTGQEVNAGEAIALSGGTPGTHGAGPMTTGPHLHFEVIKAGVNVDPKSVLP